MSTLFGTVGLGFLIGFLTAALIAPLYWGTFVFIGCFVGFCCGVWEVNATLNRH